MNYGGNFVAPKAAKHENRTYFHNTDIMTPRHLLPPSHAQPYPMFGPRGATIPPKFVMDQNAAGNRTMPNNSTFWCDSCDRGFQSSDLLNRHLNEHQKCGIDGCKFIAHPNIITKHIQMQHKAGLFKKISKLSTPEEITNWIAERKKKYPTKKNIEIKVAAQTEKFQRGERLNIRREGSNKSSGYSKSGQLNRNRDRTDNNQRNRKYGNNSNYEKRKPFKAAGRNKNHTGQRKTVEKKTFTETYTADNLTQVESESHYGSLSRFKGINEISKLDVELESIEIQNKEIAENPSDDEIWGSSIASTKDEKTPILCSALSNLINCYGSSDEDDLPVSQKLNDSNNVNNKLITTKVQSSLACEKSISNNAILSSNDINPIEINDDESGPTETKILREEIHPFHEDEKKNEKNHIKTNKARNVMAARTNHSNANKEYFLRRKLPSTLLEKLLHKEIVHERNIILQCVHFIREKKYFDN